MKLIFSLDPMLVSLTGIGRYTYELAKGLATAPTIEDLKFQFLLGWVNDPSELVEKYHATNEPHLAHTKGPFQAWLYAQARAAFWAISPAVKGWITRPYKNYIYHSPNFVLPHFVGKTVSTIHDMSTFRVPQYHPSFRVDYQRSIFPRLIQKGDLFITDSEFSKQELIDFFPQAANRVVSVPLGVDRQFQPHTNEALTPVLERYGLSVRGYSLSVGTIEPRKNIELLMDAYARLPAELRRAYPLVLVGGSGWKSDTIHEKIQRYAAQGWLRYLSFVPDGDLPALYAGASLFACISHYEGFGLPVLEAMASGTPVLCSQVASLPEVGGDAVLYVDPTKIEAVIDALEQLLMDRELCQSLVARGLVRSRAFTWERTTAETIRAYERIA